MTKNEIHKMAPCLKDGPLSDLGMKLIHQVNQIPKSISGDVLKTWITYYIFRAKEEAFKKQEDPTKEILESIQANVQRLYKS